MNRIKNIIYLESGGIIEWGGSSVAAAGGGRLAIILFDHDVVAWRRQWAVRGGQRIFVDDRVCRQKDCVCTCGGTGTEYWGKTSCKG